MKLLLVEDDAQKADQALRRGALKLLRRWRRSRVLNKGAPWRPLSFATRVESPSPPDYTVSATNSFTR